MANLSNYFLEFQQLIPIEITKLQSTKKALNFFKALNSGWLTGFEPATLGTTNQYSNQLSYNHHF